MEIRGILHKISKSLIESDNGNAILHKYEDLQKSPEWKVYQGFLVQIANELIGAMLTREYTDLDKDAKDAMQRGIFISKEVIDFLIDPTKGARRYAAIRVHNQKMEATLKRSNQGATQRGSNRKGKK